jgi:hypothetical protein
MWQHMGRWTTLNLKEAGVNVEKMPDETNWLDLSFE